jgi:hypothetical protein
MAGAQRLRWKKIKLAAEAKAEVAKPKRKLSAAARKRMAAAQKKRWAAIKEGPEPKAIGLRKSSETMIGARKAADVPAKGQKKAAKKAAA